MSISDEELFMCSFGFLYETVKRYSKIGVLPTKDLIDVGGQNGKLIGEFLAADGVNKIDFSPLTETLSFSNGFLTTFQYNEKLAKEILTKLNDQFLIFKQPMNDMMESGHIEEDLEEAPVVMLVFGYAGTIIHGLRSVSDIPDKPTMQNRIRLLRSQIKDLPQGPAPAA